MLPTLSGRQSSASPLHPLRGTGRSRELSASKERERRRRREREKEREGKRASGEGYGESGALCDLTGRRDVAFEGGCLQTHRLSCLNNVRTDVATAEQAQSEPCQGSRLLFKWRFNPGLRATGACKLKRTETDRQKERQREQTQRRGEREKSREAEKQRQREPQRPSRSREPVEGLPGTFASCCVLARRSLRSSNRM